MGHAMGNPADIHIYIEWEIYWNIMSYLLG
jgi:hypothetical protein